MNPFLSQLASKDTIELMARFFDSANDAVKQSNFNPEILEAFDLIQAISCFRYFPKVDDCVKAFPSLESERHKVEYIWNQFKGLSSEELSNIYISSLSKIQVTDKITE